MTIYWMLMDAAIYPNPKSFEPERWLETPPNHLAEMQRYFVPFAKGSRSCIGNQYVYDILSLLPYIAGKSFV
jgi:cytochrome P450